MCTLEKELNVFKKQHFRDTNIEAFTKNFKTHIKNVSSYSHLKNNFEQIDNFSNGLLTKIDFCKIIRKITYL